MSLRKCLSVLTAASVTLAVAAPLAAAAPAPSLPTTFAPNPNLCIQGGPTDMGPFGPLGPYGPSGPYGENGPLHGQANPIGNAATCGGLLTYVLRGNSLQTFVNANVASATPQG